MIRLLFALAALLSVAPASDAFALPMYASREGATCITCHVDPNGGGIRNEYGFAYEKNRHSNEPEERWANLTVDPKLNEWITLGLDVRAMYYAMRFNGQEVWNNTEFIPMQGQVNLCVMPHDHLTLVASHGLTVSSDGSSDFVGREIYGMVEGLPGETYARIGRFRLPFGLRQDDHTSSTRDLLLLTYDAQKPSAGLEIGKIGARWFAQAAIVNDDEGRAQRFAAKVGRASSTFQAALSGFNDQNPGQDDNLWSVYASATRSRVTLMGEYVGGTAAFFGDPLNSEAFFAEMDYRLARGLNLRAKLDYEDIFRDDPGGLTRRYLAEADINPVPFLETKLSFRYHEPEGGSIYQEYLVLAYFPF